MAKKWTISSFHSFTFILKHFSGKKKCFYGGNYETDIPFLVKLKYEIIEAAQSIVNHQKYQQMKSFFYNDSSKRNPLFSTLSYIMFEIEDQSLAYVT